MKQMPFRLIEQMTQELISEGYDHSEAAEIAPLIVGQEWDKSYPPSQNPSLLYKFGERFIDGEADTQDWVALGLGLIALAFVGYAGYKGYKNYIGSTLDATRTNESILQPLRKDWTWEPEPEPGPPDLLESEKL
jgi:hypothetical protein